MLMIAWLPSRQEAAEVLCEPHTKLGLVQMQQPLLVMNALFPKESVLVSLPGCQEAVELLCRSHTKLGALLELIFKLPDTSQKIEEEQHEEEQERRDVIVCGPLTGAALACDAAYVGSRGSRSMRSQPLMPKRSWGRKRAL